MKKGFTLVELVVSIVLVSVVMISLLGSLIQLRNTYNIIHENSDVLVYTSSVSRVINNDLNHNNGIRYVYCNPEGNMCELILGNDEKRHLELYTNENELSNSNGVIHTNIKTTLKYTNTTEYDAIENKVESDKAKIKLIYIRTSEVDKYQNTKSGVTNTSGFNFYDMSANQNEYTNDTSSSIDVFTTLNIRLYDGVNVDDSKYDVTLYSFGRYDYGQSNGKTYTIALNNSMADTPGTTSIDEVFGVGFYKSGVSHSSNSLIRKIEVPTKQNENFVGYFYKPAGRTDEIQIIDATGAIIANPRLFKNDVTITGEDIVYAKWESCNKQSKTFVLSSYNANISEEKTIDDLKSVRSVTTDQGTIEYEIQEGNRIVLMASGGSYKSNPYYFCSNGGTIICYNTSDDNKCCKYTISNYSHDFVNDKGEPMGSPPGYCSYTNSYEDQNTCDTYCPPGYDGVSTYEVQGIETYELDGVLVTETTTYWTKDCKGKLEYDYDYYYEYNITVEYCSIE